MGTETICCCSISNDNVRSPTVKLNNPLMGTETGLHVDTYGFQNTSQLN